MFSGDEEKKPEKEKKEGEGSARRMPGREEKKPGEPKAENPGNEGSGAGGSKAEKARTGEPKTEESMAGASETEELRKKLLETVREQEALTAELSEKNGKLTEQRSELAILKEKLISARTETDRLEAALWRSKLFIIAAAAAGAVLASVVCLMFLR